MEATNQEMNDNSRKDTEESTSPKQWILPPPPRAPDLAHNDDNDKRLYWDRSHYDSPAAQLKAVAKSSTLYVGNLAFTTRSRHVRAHFEQLGTVKTIQMGLDRFKKKPCGFCFVEYWSHETAVLAVSNLSGTKLDGRVIRVELDAGFQPGRQYGRGVSGGQVRDDRRGDPARKRVRPNESSSGGANPSESDGHYGPSGGDDEEGPSSKRQRL